MIEQIQEQEPDVVPCFGCGCQIYKEREEPRYNFCQNCKNIINGISQENTKQENTKSDLPF